MDSVPLAALASETGGVFVGRREAAGQLNAALTDQGSGGAVLTAPAGYGKTALARRALEDLRGSVMPIQLRGTDYARHRPYGTLTYLLAELDDTELGHPMLLLKGLSQWLRREAGTRDVVLLVDNAEHVDADSATLLSQLVAGGTARILILVRDLSAAAPAFLHLAQAESLQRIDLPPLSQEDVGELAAAELGARLSRSAARSLHRH